MACQFNSSKPDPKHKKKTYRSRATFIRFYCAIVRDKYERNIVQFISYLFVLIAWLFLFDWIAIKRRYSKSHVDLPYLPKSPAFFFSSLEKTFSDWLRYELVRRCFDAHILQHNQWPLTVKFLLSFFPCSVIAKHCYYSFQKCGSVCSSSLSCMHSLWLEISSLSSSQKPMLTHYIHYIYVFHFGLGFVRPTWIRIIKSGWS